MHKLPFIAVLLLLMGSAGYSQQLFRGVVIEDSVSKTPVYQASVLVRENGKEVGKVSTYFDGSFTYPMSKGKVYEFTASVPGLKDVSQTVITDKKGVPAPPSAYFLVKKDGLRLVGMVKDMNSNMPIDKADVVLKDVQTREEVRFTTGIDGRYNLKLKYETNYRVSIDKRSPGIINRYEDTVFFVSTLGFNQPLDYELDIALPKAKNLTNRTEYIPSPAKPASKPVIEVKADTITKKTVETPKEESKPEITETKSVPKNTIEYSGVALPELTLKEQKKKEKEAAKAAKLEAKEKKKQAKQEAQKAVTPEPSPAIQPTKEVAAKTQEPIAPKAPAVAIAQDTIKTATTPPKENPIVQKTPPAITSTPAPPAVSPKQVPSSAPPATTIYFAKNTAYITDFSKTKLKTIVDKLVANPKAKLSLRIHSGFDESNIEELCKKRQDAAVQYFTVAGIASNRISSTTLGKSQQANDCQQTGNCAEQKLILNRRLEVIVME